MRGALPPLHIRLQRVPQQPQQHRDRGEVRLVAHLTQRGGYLPDALGRPAQKRLGITAGVLVDEPLDVIKDRRIALENRLGTATPATHLAPGKPLTRVEFRDTPADRVNRHTRGPRRCGYPAPTLGTRLARSPQPALPLVQLRRHRPEPLTDRYLIDHASRVLQTHHKTC